MNYIERVLPSLGETSVTLRSLGEVVDGLRAARHDDPVAAAAKGSSRMISVLSRAAAAPAPGAPSHFRFFYKDDVLASTPPDSTACATSCCPDRARNQAYARVPAAVVDALWRQVSGERALEKGEEAFVDDRHDRRPFRRLRRGLVAGGRRRRRLAHPARPHRPLRRARSARREARRCRRRGRSASPSIEDVPLIDELRYLIGEVPESADDDDDAPKQLMSFERREREDRDERVRTDPEHRGRRLRPRAGRRGAGPLADAVAHARPSRPLRQLDDRGRPGAVVVAAPARVGRRARGRARGQARARLPAVDQLPQLRRDLRARRQGRRDRACPIPISPRRCAAPASSRSTSWSTPTSSRRGPPQRATSLDRVDGTVAVVAPRARSTACARARRCSASIDDRLRRARRPRHQGPGVRRRRGRRARRHHRRVRGRLAHALRRADPCHPAAHHGRHDRPLAERELA